MDIHTSPACSSCQLAILIGGKQAHLLTIKFTQASYDNRACRHIDTQREGICGKDCPQMAPGKERLYQHFQAWQ